MMMEKEQNFLRIPREKFIDFSQFDENLHKFTLPKTPIESWNFTETIQKAFDEKLKNELSPEEKNTLALLQKDVLGILKESFEFLNDYSPYEVSLSLVKGVPCTKLHADFLPLRLICTYVGPGTIFLPKESTRYPCLNEGRPNNRVHIKDKPMYQANPFEILILKGRKFNKGELKPCAHRSPEVSGNEQRLVLKIDFK